MKQRFIITALVIINSFTISAQNNNMKISSADSLASHYKKENALGAAVLNALKNKNITEWIALYPTNDEFKGIVLISPR